MQESSKNQTPPGQNRDTIQWITTGISMRVRDIPLDEYHTYRLFLEHAKYYFPVEIRPDEDKPKRAHVYVDTSETIESLLTLVLETYRSPLHILISMVTAGEAHQVLEIIDHALNSEHECQTEVSPELLLPVKMPYKKMVGLCKLALERADALDGTPDSSIVASEQHTLVDSFLAQPNHLDIPAATLEDLMNLEGIIVTQAAEKLGFVKM